MIWFLKNLYPKIIFGIGFKIIIISLFIVFHISFGKSSAELMVFNTTDISNTAKEIVITFIVPEKDYIYKDFITCSVNEPTVTLSPWKASMQSVNYYDASFKDTKQVFNENFSLTMIVTTQKYDTEPVYLYCSYYRCSEKKINHIILPLFFSEPVCHDENIDDDIPLPKDVVHQKAIHSYKLSVEDYFVSLIDTIKHTIALPQNNYKIYVGMLLLMLFLLSMIMYFCKELLQSYVRCKELIEWIFSLLILVGILYGLMYLYTISNPLVIVFMTFICAISAGFFYIQKSTNLHSRYLRTLSTFLGMVLICSAIFLLFKILQHADDQFGLLYVLLNF